MRTSRSAQPEESSGLGGVLRRPRWVVATLVVIAVCVVFTSLGNWQLRRHEERRLENQILATRLASDPVDLGTAVDAAGADVDSLDYRPVTAVGRFVPSDEVLLRSQVEDGRPGFHIVTPFVTTGGTVLVDRGWVPLAAERPPVDEVPPPAGEVTITGVMRASQERAAVGPIEPDGRLETIARIDLDRLAPQFDDLLPVWVQESTPATDELPVRAPLPDADDPGPHLAYAFQWFSFAVITAVGFGLLLRRSST